MEDTRIAVAQINCPAGRLAENVEKRRAFTGRAALQFFIHFRRPELYQPVVRPSRP
jgi:hypothetical protein